jgi:TetR/AcrR family transcriptional repressor of nem operon
MRYPSAHKQASRERIVEAASRLFRARGIASTGVDAVMSAVGLTPGGFYNHFKSKQLLVAEVVERTIRGNRERLTAGLDDLPNDEWIAGYLRRYLSAKHRDKPEEGCPLAALGSELPHLDAARPVVASEVETYVTLFAKKLKGDGKATPRQRALATIAMAVGAISLARAMAGSPLSDELLEACRAAGAR